MKRLIFTLLAALLLVAAPVPAMAQGKISMPSQKTKAAKPKVAKPKTDKAPQQKNKPQATKKTESPAATINPASFLPAGIKLAPGYHNLDLCVSKNGNYYAFSQQEWNRFSASEKSSYKPLGVIVVGEKEPPFVLALHDSDKELTWSEALSHYGSSLPSNKQGEEMVCQYKAINAAIKAYGGDDNPRKIYWTKDDFDSTYAWAIYMTGGVVGNAVKFYTCPVRAVAPIK